MEFDALLIIIAIVCFVLAAIPKTSGLLAWLPIGLAFFAAGHIWSRLLVQVQ